MPRAGRHHSPALAKLGPVRRRPRRARQGQRRPRRGLRWRLRRAEGRPVVCHRDAGRRRLRSARAARLRGRGARSCRGCYKPGDGAGGLRRVCARLILTTALAAAARRRAAADTLSAPKRRFFFTVTLSSAKYGANWRLHRLPVSEETRGHGTIASPGAGQGYRMWRIPVVSTGAPLDFARGKLHAERRDLVSMISGLSWREGPSTRPFGPWSGRREIASVRYMR